jgi:hypothetical protein
LPFLKVRSCGCKTRICSQSAYKEKVQISSGQEGAAAPPGAPVILFVLKSIIFEVHFQKPGMKKKYFIQQPRWLAKVDGIH